MQSPIQTPEPAQPHLRLAPAAQAQSVEIVIPVHNEQYALRTAVETLERHLRDGVPAPCRLTIADNASTDATERIGRELAHEFARVSYMRIEGRGRGRALRAAWSASHADVLAYMDVDLSTELTHLQALLDPLLDPPFGARADRRADIAIGTRLAAGAVVTRGLKRELISRTYNILLAATLGAGFSDAQCGFKAGRREAIQALLPLIEDNGWFFDTELLYLAQRNAFSIREIPVHWIDDPDSRVRIARTALEDLRGIARLRRRTRDGADRLLRPSAKPRPLARTVRRCPPRRGGYAASVRR
jgi:glycosyltransferase involved in cell wall biosynthesis